jgi:hypothetical protein
VQEEIHERPQITSMIGSLANYSNTIPAAPDAAEGDAKPAQPASRMGELFKKVKTETEKLLKETKSENKKSFCIGN